MGYFWVNNSLFENYVTEALLSSVDHIFSQNILLEHRINRLRFSVFIPGFKHTINRCIYNIDVACIYFETVTM